MLKHLICVTVICLSLHAAYDVLTWSYQVSCNTIRTHILSLCCAVSRTRDVLKKARTNLEVSEHPHYIEDIIHYICVRVHTPLLTILCVYMRYFVISLVSSSPLVFLPFLFLRPAFVSPLLL